MQNNEIKLKLIQHQSMEVQICQPKKVGVTNLDSPDNILYRNGFDHRKEMDAIEEIDESEGLFGEIVWEPTSAITNNCNNVINEFKTHVGKTELVSSVAIQNIVLRQNGSISDTTNHVSNKVIVFDQSDVDESDEEMDSFVKVSNVLIDHEVGINELNNDIVLTDSDDMFLYYEEIENKNRCLNIGQIDQTEDNNQIEEIKESEKFDVNEEIDKIGEIVLKPAFVKANNCNNVINESKTQVGTSEAFTESVSPVAIPNIVRQQNRNINLSRRGTWNSQKLSDPDKPGCINNENNGNGSSCNSTMEIPSVKHKDTNNNDPRGGRPPNCKSKTRTMNAQHKTNKIRKKSQKCSICSKSFRTPHELKTHHLSHTKEKPYKCGVCQKGFIYSTYLKIHGRTHTGEKPYSCGVCEKSFIQSSNLIRHERTHTGEKPYMCGVCEMSFALSSTLKRHEKIHTGEKRYKCGVCKKRFIQSYNLKMHERNHTVQKTCGLKIHARLHMPVLPYQCSYCNRSFSRWCSLEDHVRTHTMEKPYNCPHCKMEFTSRNGLTQHKKTHIIGKPYKCSHCDASFKRTKYRATHERRHNEETDFKCYFCELKFITNEFRISHEMKVHSHMKKVTRIISVFHLLL